jgi:hypothetical protein
MADVQIPAGRWGILAHAYYRHTVLSSDADLKDIKYVSPRDDQVDRWLQCGPYASLTV